MSRFRILLAAAGGLVLLGGVTAALAATGDTSASCSSTPNPDGTVPCTIQASVDVTPPTVTTSVPVPGPTTTVTETTTQTVTQTVTVTAPPPPPTTTTTPPPPAGFHAPGQDVNASNTGYGGDGITPSQLTVVNGSTTYGTGFNGQTISLKSYRGTVYLSGNNITLKDCEVYYGGNSTAGVQITGDNDTVDHCAIHAPVGQSMYEPVWILPGADGNVITRNNIYRGENLLSTYGSGAVIKYNYLHDVALDSDPSDHPDGIEIFAGTTVNIQANWIEENNLYDSPIDVGAYGSYKLNGLTVQDNFIDNGQSTVLADNQNGHAPCSLTQPVGDCLINTRILRNAMGGHTCPGDNPQCFDVYKGLDNDDARPIVQTDAQLAANPNAIRWPTSGADANYWEQTGAYDAKQTVLSPNRNDQIVLPTCPDPC